MLTFIVLQSSATAIEYLISKFIAHMCNPLSILIIMPIAMCRIFTVPICFFLNFMLQYYTFLPHWNADKKLLPISSFSSTDINCAFLRYQTIFSIG